MNFRFPEKQIEHLGRLGLMSACIDQQYGGAGYDLLACCLSVEELARCCASTGIIVSIHNCLYAQLIQTYGTPKQIDEFLIPFTSGDIGVFALSEHGISIFNNYIFFDIKKNKYFNSDAGSDAANISTIAIEKGDHYVLNGCKAWITSGYEAKAGVFFATTDQNAGHKGITAFLVSFDTPGVKLGQREDKLGIRATSTCDIILQDVRLPKENVIGGLGNGFKIAMNQLQIGRIGVASQALGIGQAAFELALNYASTRTVLGGKLSEKQLVKVISIKFN